ncbi:SRPBCC family protein [Salinimicrobium sp. GXAS 041]|uniref:SRPBCC family protein n=1 Tax=Salinimicrobium sp. GXAS 041 TaxID=3400806 RepID=UPI003C716FF8
MKKLTIPGLNPNVGKNERIISLLGGAYILYDALGKKEKSFTEAAFAGFLLFRGATGYCGIYDAMGKTKPDAHSRNVNIRVTQTVGRPPEEVFEFWSKFENLPLFMEHLESVNSINDHISLWKAELPGGVGTLSWKSEIVKIRQNEFIGWQSLPGSDIENAGKVEFKEIPGYGTEVDVVISYSAPGGIPGEGAARLINPLFEKMVKDDVSNFKQFMEEYNEPGERDLAGKL